MKEMDESADVKVVDDEPEEKKQEVHDDDDDGEDDPELEALKKKVKQMQEEAAGTWSLFRARGRASLVCLFFPFFPLFPTEATGGPSSAPDSAGQDPAAGGAVGAGSDPQGRRGSRCRRKKRQGFALRLCWQRGLRLDARRAAGALCQLRYH